MKTISERIIQQSRLIEATQVKPGSFIDVVLLTDKPENGTISCCVQRRSHTRWMVSHCGSSAMPVKWSFNLKNWVFCMPWDY